MNFCTIVHMLALERVTGAVRLRRMLIHRHEQSGYDRHRTARSRTRPTSLTGTLPLPSSA